MRVSDRILALIRRIFHNNPEFRHDSLKHVARFAPIIPFMGGRPDLSKTLNRVVTFADGSNPLHFGCPIMLAAGANKTAKRICDFANMGFTDRVSVLSRMTVQFITVWASTTMASMQ